MDEINIGHVALFVGTGSITGYLLFLTIRFVLPRRLRKSHEEQRGLVIQKAFARKEQILAEAKKRSDEKMVLLTEELEANLDEERLTLEATEADLVMQEQFITHEQERIENARKEEEARQIRSQLKKEYDLTLTNLRAAKIKLDDLQKFKLLRSASEKEAQVEEQLEIIRELENELERLERTLEQE